MQWDCGESQAGMLMSLKRNKYKYSHRELHVEGFFFLTLKAQQKLRFLL